MQLRIPGRRRLKIFLSLLAFCFIASALVYYVPQQKDYKRGGAALVSLVKQRELDKIVEMIRNVEDRYNHKFRHDWVFLSEEEFRPDFVETVSAFASGKADFRTIDRKSHWKIPSSVDRGRLANDMRNLDIQGVPFGGSTTFRLMCRFQSGFFMHYLPDYKYYARIDPDVRLLCDIDDDLFDTLRRGDKKFGFAISAQESPHSVHDLSQTINKFMVNNSDIVHEKQWVDSFVKPWDQFCAFPSYFEVADLDFYRSEEYQALFEYIDETGGMFYNRWSDSSIHTLAVALFTEPNDVHWFENIGLYHSSRITCPPSHDKMLVHKCTCKVGAPNLLGRDPKIFTYRKESCVPDFLDLLGSPFQDDWREDADGGIIEKFSSNH